MVVVITLDVDDEGQIGSCTFGEGLDGGKMDFPLDFVFFETVKT